MFTIIENKTTLGQLLARKNEIFNIKKIVNCILENGAYSNDNEKMQLVRGANNYNPQEKILVKTSWKFRKLQGKMMQEGLKTYFEKNKDFLAFLKTEDEELYGDLKELII